MFPPKRSSPLMNVALAPTMQFFPHTPEAGPLNDPSNTSLGGTCDSHRFRQKLHEHIFFGVDIVHCILYISSDSIVYI